MNSNNLKFVKITKENIILATKFQMSIFPTECGYEHFLYTINSGKDYLGYYLVYNGETLIGITGIYSFENIEDANSLWLGWFGVAEEYRNKGFGTSILLKTIDMAKSFSLKYPAVKYFRLYTSTRENPLAIKLYRKHMDIEEKYLNEKDFTYDGTCVIFTKVLNSDSPLKKWNNEFLNLTKIIEDEEKGNEIFNDLK